MRLHQSIAIKFLAAVLGTVVIPASIVAWMHIGHGAASEREHLASNIGSTATQVTAAINRHNAIHDPVLTRDLLAPLTANPDVTCAQVVSIAAVADHEVPDGVAGCEEPAPATQQLRLPVDEGRFRLLVNFSDERIISTVQRHRDLLANSLLAGLFLAVIASVLGFRFIVGRRLKILNGTIQQIASGGERRPVPPMGRDELGCIADGFNRLIKHEEYRENELNRTEAALRRSNDKLAEITTDSEHRLRDFMAFASDWYWEMDEELRFSYFSNRFTEVTGVPNEALLGKTRLESGIPNVCEKAWQEHLRCLAERRPIRNFEHPRTRDNGETVWLSISGTPVFDSDGAFKGYRGTGTDVTQRVLAERLQHEKTIAEQITRTKDEFLANMSHEIRTPINGVLGMAELLHKTELDTTQKRFASTIVRSAQALLRVINDILDFSKLEAGKMTLQSAPFCLRELVEDVGELFAESAHSKGLELVTFLPADVPTGFWGDGGRLRQVLTNLTGNAIKFTAKGEVLIHVECVETDGDGCELRFEVRDTGIGVDESQQAHIFESFAQADGSTGRQFGGTGLGLSISAQLCRLMGGDIGIISAPGAGSTFWFHVRMTKATDGEVPVSMDPKGLVGRRILIVDNHPTNREILELQLCAWDIDCDCASSGTEALQMLEAADSSGTPYEVAILDMHMPGMDGAELAARIDGDPRYSSLCRIMLSSVGQNLDREHLERVGVRTHLLKPVRKAELRRCLQMVLHCESTLDQGPAPTLENGSPHPDAPSPGARILLVEDNLVNQEVALAWLEHARAIVVTAEHGREAVDYYRSNEFDLILMDCQMPGMNGFDATRAIRELESSSGKPRTPIVALTANALSGDRQRCLEAGMDDYLSKPYSESNLYRVLRGWLANSAESVADTEAADAPADRTEEVLDTSMLDGFRARAGLLERLVSAYLNQSAHQMQQLRDAVAADDLATVRESAHALRSSSAQLGATSLTRHYQSLESSAHAGDSGALTELLAAAQDVYPEFCAALSAQSARAAA